MANDAISRHIMIYQVSFCQFVFQTTNEISYVVNDVKLGYNKNGEPEYTMRFHYRRHETGKELWNYHEVIVKPERINKWLQQRKLLDFVNGLPPVTA